MCDTGEGWSLYLSNMDSRGPSHPQPVIEVAIREPEAQILVHAQTFMMR